MTNETEQLRRMVDARERATKGPWICRAQSGVGNQQIDLLDEIVPEYSPDQTKSIRPTAEFIALSGTLDLHAILTRMEKMEEALRFYADHKRNTKDGIYGRDNIAQRYFEHDQGQRAKEALE